MSKLFRFGEAQTQIAALTEQLNAANEALTKANASVAALAAVTAERDGFKAKLDESATVISTLTTERDALKASIAPKDAEILALKAAAKTAQELAAEMVAAVGIQTPVKTETADSAKTNAELWDTYKAIDAKDIQGRRDFYVKHLQKPAK